MAGFVAREPGIGADGAEPTEAQKAEIERRWAALREAKRAKLMAGDPSPTLEPSEMDRAIESKRREEASVGEGNGTASKAGYCSKCSGKLPGHGHARGGGGWCSCGKPAAVKEARPAPVNRIAKHIEPTREPEPEPAAEQEQAPVHSIVSGGLADVEAAADLVRDLVERMKRESPAVQEMALGMFAHATRR